MDDYISSAPKTETLGLTPCNRIREIHIKEVARGYIVSVGCQTFAISTKEELILKLIDYINKPYDTERKWNDGSLFLTF